MVKGELAVYDNSKVLVLIHTLYLHTVDERGRRDIFTLAPEVNTQFLSFIHIQLEKVVTAPFGKPLNSTVVVLSRS